MMRKVKVSIVRSKDEKHLIHGTITDETSTHYRVLDHLVLKDAPLTEWKGEWFAKESPRVNCHLE